MQTEQYEVVIVGAGPAGMAAALTLGTHGIETLLVERRLTISSLPRATSVSTGTMELLRRWRLEGLARERSEDADWKVLACRTLAEAASGEPVDVGMPTREQASLVSPAAPAVLAQHEIELLLAERLGALPSVRVERGVEVRGLERTPDGRHALSLAGPGGPRRAGARYVIGADGVRGAVRERLGIAAAGPGELEERLAIQFRAPVWDLVGEHRYAGYFLTGAPEGRFFFSQGRPDRWVFGMHWDSATQDAARLPAGRAAEWIRAAAGVPHLPVEVDRIMPVSYGVALAQRFREGDAFLVGDAAHRVTPRGGTGLNTAIRDGFDIGWKLAWVLRGWAAEPLLDSYERERRPVAEFNTERSMRHDGSLLATTTGLAADIGGRMPHAWVRRDGGLVSTLDLLGDGLTLFVGPRWDGRVPDLGGTPPMAVERLDAIAARALALGDDGALLARPDGHPVALWNEQADPQRLERAVSAVTGSARVAMAR